MAFSVNVLIQDTHEIPVNLDDSIAIYDFLSRNEGKKVRR